MLKRLALLFLLSAVNCFAQAYIPHSGGDGAGLFGCDATTNTAIPQGAGVLFASYGGDLAPTDSHSNVYSKLSEVGGSWFLYGTINNEAGFITASSHTGVELQSCTILAYTGPTSPITVDAAVFLPTPDWTASHVYTVGPITTTNTTDLLLTGILSAGGAGVAYVPAATSSFTQDYLSPSTANNSFFSKYVNTVGTYSSTISISPGDQPAPFNDGIFLVAIKVNGPPPSTATLTGTIQYPNGNLFNGKLSITLPRASALDICTNPYQIVRAAPVDIPVVDGVPTGEFTTFLANYCLTPSIPYYVQMFDTKNVNVDSTNWMVIPDVTGHMDVGTLVSSGFGGPIVVAVPNPIVSNPAGAQLITQPVGTALSINNLTCTGICTGFQASEFAVTPSICPTGFFSTGIHPNGDSYCALIGTGVTSFNTRTGAVSPQSGDYSYSMISGTPTLYNQNLYANTILQSQTTGLDFSTNFILSTEGTPNANTIDLANIGTPGTYVNPSSITIDAKGRVANILGGTSSACGTHLGTNCTTLPGGLLMEWGITSGLGSAWPNPVPITFPVPFPSTCYTVTLSSIFVGRNVAIASISNSQFVATISGSTGEATWVAIGK